MRRHFAALAAVLPVAAAAGVGLPDCTIDFEGACPNAGAQCGASFSGGGGCIFAGLPFCYSSGLRSYQVTQASPVTITLSDSISRLDVFFSEQGTAAGAMRFFDAVAGGNEVGSPLITNGNCLSFMPDMQLVSFLAPVRRIEVEVTSASGTVWIDDLRLNPPNACPTDTNDDLTTNVDDLVNIIITWGGPGGVADVNGDGVVSVDDLVEVITFWGPC